ncbi:modification methylase [Haloferax mucosum ATCC BAA-1512]|uniref:site-specific DNA-methyltransferase (cytosine-N(4)-specific) n=1 Tax=Haloferax mucosum ATCC BAA-1512 TaxID=662479 RepID=M0II35_9EURY|nr:site-specific DNA-methyltransferase [Haloferax mucosum]ELZ96441.1 modification methylase [Haloferax mucosum ATCC BAA-1512]
MASQDSASRVAGGLPDDARYGMYQGDTRFLKEVLSANFTEEELDGNLVDTTVTSPPYADKKNYEADEELQIGLGQTYDDYLEDLRDVYRQTYDVTKDTGTLWVVVNTIKKDQRMVRIPFDIADLCENLEGVERCEECNDRLVKNRETGELECEQCGWTHDPLENSWRLQEVVVWDKKRARPWSRKGQFRNVFEYILCFSKTKDFKFNLDNIRIADPDEFKQWWVGYPERYNPRGKVPSNIWRMVTPTQGSWGDGNIDHPAPFPPEMVERITNLTTDGGDVVFDPFAGSGTVLAQAEAMGRKPLGVELSEVYPEMYESLREDLLDDWQERMDAGDTLERRQELLEQTICTLRQLNYPREMTRRIRKEVGADSLDELGINTAFQMSHEVVDHEKFDKDHLFMEDDLYWVVDDELSDEEIREITEAAEKVADEAPCSKFGIVANIKVKRVSEMVALIDSDAWDWPSSLYLYSNDTQNIYERKISVEEWAQSVRSTGKWRDNTSKNHYPAIISNLECDVEEPKDEWREKNGNSGSSSGRNSSLSDF